MWISNARSTWLVGATCLMIRGVVGDEKTVSGSGVERRVLCHTIDSGNVQSRDVIIRRCRRRQNRVPAPDCVCACLCVSGHVRAACIYTSHCRNLNGLSRRGQVAAFHVEPKIF